MATPRASPTPEARSGFELIEPAPGAFVHRTFEDGEAIDWAHGVYVFDVETGLTEGYARAGVENDAVPHIYGARGYSAHRGGWITSSDEDDEDREWRLLLDRETDGRGAGQANPPSCWRRHRKSTCSSATGRGRPAASSSRIA